MDRRWIPGLIALFLLLCLVAAAAAGPYHRWEGIVAVLTVWLSAMVIARSHRWYAGTHVSSATPQPVERVSPPARAVAAVTEQKPHPVVFSSYEPGGGLYYVRHISGGPAVNVFVIGTDTTGAISVVEVGPLHAGESRLLSRQGLARRNHLVVAEGQFPDTRQWSPMACRRSSYGFYITASELPNVPSLADRMNWPAFRTRYLHDAERDFLGER